MQLALVVQPPWGAARDVVVDVDPTGSTTDLARMLASRVSRQREVDATVPILFHPRLGTWLDPSAPIASLGLRSGDGVLVGPRRGLPAAGRARTHGRVELAVVGGRDAGRRFALPDGEHVVGRCAEASVTLTDAGVSRRHCRVRVSPQGVTVLDLEASTTRVEGTALVGERALGDGELVTVGSSMFSVRPARSAEGSWPLDDSGHVRFNRPPRRVPRARTRRLTIPAPPTRPPLARFSTATAIAPLIMGFAFYVFTKNPLMLMFMALSPVIAVWSVIEDRRRGGNAFRRQRREFLEHVARARVDVAVARVSEARERRAAAPDPAEVLACATGYGPELWERRPVDPDFLTLRVGVADLSAELSVHIEPGGCAALRGEAQQLLGETGTVVAVPVLVDLRRAGSIGVVGHDGGCARLAAWLVVQAVTLQSPRELAVAAAIGSRRLEEWDWLKWLPHGADSSLLSGPHLALDVTDARKLVERLLTFIDVRRAQSRSLGALDASGPFLLVVLHEDAGVDRAIVSRLLAEGPAAGVLSIWIGRSARDLPGECGVTVEVADGDARLTRHERDDRGAAPRELGRVAAADLGSDDDTQLVSLVDGISFELARRVGLALAPVRDVGAPSSASSLPRVVSLLDLLELADPSAAAVLERWRRPHTGLEAVIGMAADGRLLVDLRHDGPHVLVAGTTGSGKSELLQSLVASLAATHCRDRLTFLLVDYKGGAAFSECLRLPHAVGFVTDLDGRLAQRVLVSLNAEVRRREAILRDAGAKDLVELEQRDPEIAPPSLVVVIDEFAALVREVPDFVDGVIDVSQRGRSLGLHLVLATQRPNGVVNESIRANTNLRIALRVHDVADSQDVVRSDEAARIPRFVPGRAYARMGHAELMPFQSAYAGGRTDPAASTAGGRISELVFGAGGVDDGDAVGSRPATTDLRLLVDAIRAADATLALAPSVGPWLPPLPDVVSARGCGAPTDPDDPARRMVVGLLDEPSHQRQRVLAIDLERDGSVLVFGTGGAGKTTALRSMAASLARAASPDDLHLYALDFASRGLEPLRALPQCGEVIAADDAARVTRLLTRLDKLAGERKAMLAAAGVATLAEYRAVGDAPAPPRVLIVVDGYGTFLSTFERVDFGDWVERFHRLVADGRPLGLHFVITADRRGAVPAALMSSISTRVVMRMAEEDELVALGVPTKLARGAVLPPGRGFVGELEVQVALVGDGVSGGGEAGAVERLGSALCRRWGSGRAPGVPVLPSHVATAALPAPSSARRPLVGIGDGRFEPVAVDLARASFVVAGPPGSGRSTALRALARSIARAGEPVDVHLLVPRAPELPAIAEVASVTSGFEACEDAIVELATWLHGFGPGDERLVVVLVDDATDLVDGPAAASLEALVRAGARRPVRVVAAVDAFAALRSFGGFVTELRRTKHGLLLRPDLEADGDLLGVRLRCRPGQHFPPGRGFLVGQGVAELVQVAEE